MAFPYPKVSNTQAIKKTKDQDNGQLVVPSAVRETQRALCHRRYGTGNQCPKGRQGSHSLCPKAPQAPTPNTL